MSKTGQKGQGNGCGWPSANGNPSGKGRSNNPTGGGKSSGNSSGSKK